MNLQILCFPIILPTFFLFVLMVLKILTKRASSASKQPPGPWKLPILGSLHHLVGPLPHQKFRDLSKKHGPIMYLKIGQVPTIVVSSPEHAKEVMRTHDLNFATRPRSFASRMVVYDYNDIMFAPYGDFWRQLRKISARELLSAKRVQSFKPIREEEMVNLVEWAASNAGSAINLTKIVKHSMNRIISQVTFGGVSEGCDDLMDIIEESSLLAARFHLPELFPSLGFLAFVSEARTKSKRLRQKADGLLENIIKEHQDKKKRNEKCCETKEDLVDILLKFHDNENLGFSLTMDNIKAVIWDIISAGSKSSITSTDWAMAEMIKNPRVMKKAQQEVREVFNKRGSVDEESINEMTYLKCVVKEILRLHTPVTLLPKECGEKCEIGGYEIPAKTRVMVNAWAIGRDPRFWTEPESFVPERFLDSYIDYKGRDFEYIPFGAGRRICPGISLGVISVEILLASLLYHFDWKLPDGMRYEDLDMSESFGLTVKRKDDLHLIPIAYYDHKSTNGKISKNKII